jgi:hypothetical protein
MTPAVSLAFFLAGSLPAISDFRGSSNVPASTFQRTSTPRGAALGFETAVFRADRGEVDGLSPIRRCWSDDLALSDVQSVPGVLIEFGVRELQMPDHLFEFTGVARQRTSGNPLVGP